MKQFIAVLCLSISLQVHTAQLTHVSEANRTLAEQKEINDTFISAMMNIYRAAEQALAQGADVNAKTQAGDTLLILWLKGVDITHSGWFLEQGPSPFVKKDNGKNAYDYGCIKPRRFIALLEHPVHKKTVTSELCKIFAEQTPIHMKELVSLIQEYALCGPTTENLNAALFKAIWDCNNVQVQFFLRYGADSNARDEEQQTPLIIIPNVAAIQSSMLSEKHKSLLTIIDLLFAYNADIFAIEKDGRTALGKAYLYSRSGSRLQKEFITSVMHIYENHIKKISDKKLSSPNY